MLGAGVTLAQQALALDWQPDVILATDMLNLPVFLAMTRPRFARTPIALYFHENQLTYPVGPRQKQKKELAFINYSSALAADAVLFNSDYHQSAFLDELPRFLKHYGDHNELQTVDAIQQKAQVLPVGIDLQRLDAHRPATIPDAPPLIVWNHRWEPDKNPKPFFKALLELATAGIDFRVAILGENFSQAPTAFLETREQLGERVMQFGYVESQATYAEWLWRADVVVSTAYQEFFGISVVEAMYCGCYPVLPNRLSYPQFIPPEHQKTMLYKPNGLLPALKRILTTRPQPPDTLARAMAQYDWSQMAPRYDAILSALAA